MSSLSKDKEYKFEVDKDFDLKGENIVGFYGHNGITVYSKSDNDNLDSISAFNNHQSNYINDIIKVLNKIKIEWFTNTIHKNETIIKIVKYIYTHAYGVFFKTDFKNYIKYTFYFPPIYDKYLKINYNSYTDLNDKKYDYNNFINNCNYICYKLHINKLSLNKQNIKNFIVAYKFLRFKNKLINKYKEIINFGIDDLYLKIEKENYEKELQHKNEIEKELLKYNSEKEILQSTIIKMSNNHNYYINSLILIIMMIINFYFYFWNNNWFLIY